MHSITNVHRNALGTTDFHAQFDGMRKPQEFCVFPIKRGDAVDLLTIQSDTRIGQINVHTGAVTLSPPRASGMGLGGLALATPAGTLSAEALLLLKSHVFDSASERAGTCGMHCDNIGAARVFGGVLS